MPRTTELDDLDDMIFFSGYVTGDLGSIGKLTDKKIEVGETLLVAGLWIAFFLGLACWRFSVKDY